MTYIERARAMRPLMVQAAQDFDDDTAYSVPYMFDAWSPDSVEYAVGDRVRFGESLYKCVQAHTSQLGWEPPNVPALFTKVAAPGEIPVWVQPTGAQDAYMTGDKVWYPDKQGSIYESLIDNNVWAPDAYPQGWAMIN